MISEEQTPALGDIRLLGAGDVVLLARNARDRNDWARILDAVAAAVSRGCDVHWVNR